MFEYHMTKYTELLGRAIYQGRLLTVHILLNKKGYLTNNYLTNYDS